MRNCGFSQEKALMIESKYGELYKHSIEWVNAKLKQATKDGYITCAFGLRVRTPVLHQVISGTRKTPSEARAEGRTAGNALGQSWCCLNLRSASETMEAVLNSKFKDDIKLCASIHDATYFIVKDDVGALKFLNDTVVKATLWQDHPDIYHPEVHLGGELDIFYPTWANKIGIKPNASKEAIISTVEKTLNA